MKEPIKVLSLFDGMSCGRLALAKANIPVAQYHASEVDKWAIQVTTANWPDTLQLGSVVDVTVTQHYDLLCGGSPCQSFSFAGKRKGMATKCETEILTLPQYLQLKAECYEFEGQSYLFWEYVRILQECRSVNPNIKFLLENVIMAEKWERVITQTLGVKPIRINSALVSAQNRHRLYWTNIGLQPSGLFDFEESIIPQPADRGILLKDILQTNVPEKYYLSDKMLNYLHTRKDNFNGGKINFKNQGDKGSCLNASHGLDISDNIIVDDDLNRKARTFTAGGNSGGLHSQMELVCTVIQLNDAAEFGGQPSSNNRVYSPEGISPALMAQMSCGTHAILEDNTIIDFSRQNEGLRFYTNKAPTMNARDYKQPRFVNQPNTRIRRLTPTECERLQTVPDGYTNHVSDTQRYKMLGNGWTVDVIAHIFIYL
jgi:DNA (cytosine-5)-methyltransferase 3A